MEKPTLEEVKKRYKNAKEVICAFYKKKMNITENIVKDIHEWDGNFCIDFNNWESCFLFDDENGYAEILTYKEPTYQITADQLMQLENGFTLPKLQKWFPEVFVKKLEAGRWYKSDIGGLWFVEEFKNGIKNQVSFGINKYGEWIDRSYSRASTGLEEATEQEVFEALKKEAVKLGFEVGSVFKSVGFDSRFEVCQGEIEICKNMLPGSFGLQFGEGNGLIMKDGIWADVYKKV